MRIIFAGTPEFACPALDSLVEQHEVVAVFTQPDRRAGRGKKLHAPPVKVLAVRHEVPVYQPESLKDQTSLIQSLNADVMVVVAYGMILPKPILELPRLGCLNIHASLLPRWRGAAPIQRAIEAGDDKTGVSIMQMEAGLDTGPVFETLTTEIKHTDTSSSLHDRLSKLGARGICSTLNALDENPQLVPAKQDDSLASYAKKITKGEAEIDWASSALEIQCKIRAFIPWPVCQSHHLGTRVRIWQASVSRQTVSAHPGTIVAVDDGVHVACGDGVLKIERLQRDGSKPLSIAEFVNGYSLAIDEQFDSPASE